jgi:hypothetical protein
MSHDPRPRGFAVLECSKLPQTPKATLGSSATNNLKQSPLMRALLMSHTQGNVDHKLKEVIRILLARFAKDKYFASLRSTKARDMGLTEKRIDEGTAWSRARATIRANNSSGTESVTVLTFQVGNHRSRIAGPDGRGRGLR